MQGQFIQEGFVVEQEQDVLPVLPSYSERKETLMEFLGTTWTIVEEKVDEDNSDGICDFNNQTLKVNPELVFNRKGLALTHEMLHAVMDFAGMPEDTKLVFKDTDDLIGRIEHGVYDLVNNFPKKYKRRYER